MAKDTINPAAADLVAQLTAENAALKEQLVKLQADKAALDEEEQLIARKVESGLTRQQAITVIRTQKAHDEAIAKQWETRRPKIVEILQQNLKPRDERLAIRDADASITLEEINAAKDWLAKQSKSAAA